MTQFVVHCKKAPYDIYIGRPSEWGNPFVIGKDGSREEVIFKYEKWLRGNQNLMKKIQTLHGKILGCWCSPKSCHGDVLYRLANDVPFLGWGNDFDTPPLSPSLLRPEISHVFPR